MRAEENEIVSNSNDSINQIPNKLTDNLSDDGFKLVGSKTKSKKHAFALSPSSCSTNKPLSGNKQSIDLAASELSTKIETIKLKLKSYDENFYWSKMQLVMSNLIKSYFENSNSIQNKINITCYGLGSIDDQFASRYQFALLLLIIDELKAIALNSDSSSRCLQIASVELYDPLFNEIDRKLLTDIHSFSLDLKNCKCMKQVDLLGEKDCEVLNFFYMPHCGKALYNNLLYANWSIKCLNKIVILGNSFNTLALNTLERVMNQCYSFIKDSNCFVKEIKLDDKCELTDAFYDFSFLTFKLRLNEISNFKFINRLDVELDSKNLLEPVYDENSEEIF